MNYRWSDLLDKYLKGEITEKELNELHRQAVLSKSKQEQFEKFATQKGIINQLIELSKINPADKWEIFKKQLYAPARPIRRSNYGSFKVHPVRTMAVAVSIAILSTVIFYTFNLRQHTVIVGKLPQLTQKLVTEKEPVLILFNGTIIKLDSVPNGARIAPGIPFMKKDSTLVPVRVQPEGQVSADSFNILSVPPGRQYQIILTDGTLIKVNASSQLSFPAYFSANERLVAMNGEAWFEVKANRVKPFFVNVNNKLLTKVTGTSFNIQAYNYNDYIKTTLVEGHLTIIDDSSKKTKSLQPGQQANYKNGSFIIYDNPNIEHVIAWKKGLFDFNNASIYEIMQEIGRWYKVEIRYEGTIPAITSSGVLPRPQTLSEMIKILSVNNQICIKIIKDTLIVSPKQQPDTP